MLTEDAFTYDGTSYVFKTIFLRSTGRLSIEIEPTLTGDALNLTLDVDGTTFAFQDADVMTDSNTASIRHWDSSGLSWTAGDTVALKLTAPATTLVSNLGQPTTGLARLDGTLANTFSTGSNTAGYILSSIVLDYKDADPGSAVDLQVREMDTSNNFLEATVLYAFTRPAAFATGELTFTAPADAELDANKTYAVVMITSDALADQPFATGWDMGDDLLSLPTTPGPMLDRAAEFSPSPSMAASSQATPSRRSTTAPRPPAPCRRTAMLGPTSGPR